MTYGMMLTYVCVLKNGSVKLLDICVVPFTEGTLIFAVLLTYCILSGYNILLLTVHTMYNRSLNVIFFTLLKLCPLSNISPSYKYSFL